MKSWQKILLYIIGVFGRLINLVVNPAFKYIYDGKKHKKIPKVDDQLLLKPAIDLAVLIRSKQVGSEEIVKLFISRIEKVNPDLNAVVANRFDNALEEARKIDEILQAPSIPEEYSVYNKPLLGIPFTAKEAFAITGLPNTSGLQSRKHVISREDCDAVKQLRAAGAIPLAVTNCSELCMWYESNNLLYGRTANAYHAGRTVGGSSGGEGCVQSFAGSAFGLGSDIGGSIRMPAFFNGIFGHKGTTGIVSNSGQFPDAMNDAQAFLSSGPMCRYAKDLLPLLNVLVKPECKPALKLDEQVNLKAIKCYYMLNDGGYIGSAVDSQIQQAILKAVSHLEGVTGEASTQLSLRKLQHSFQLWATKMSTSGNDTFCYLMGNSFKAVNPFEEFLLWLLCRPNHTLPAIGLGIVEKIQPPKRVQDQHIGMCEALKEEFHQILGDNGVFIYPTHPVPAPYHNQPLFLIPNIAYTAIFNVLGLPCTAVPMGLSKDGLPLGIQVVGWQNNDRLTIAVANELEKAFGGWIPPE